jgi:hypothetical protein
LISQKYRCLVKCTGTKRLTLPYGKIPVIFIANFYSSQLSSVIRTNVSRLRICFHFLRITPTILVSVVLYNEQQAWKFKIWVTRVHCVMKKIYIRCKKKMQFWMVLQHFNSFFITRVLGVGYDIPNVCYIKYFNCLFSIQFNSYLLTKLFMLYNYLSTFYHNNTFIVH